MVDGLNRKPGLIRGCGGEGGDAPTEGPLHDFTCTDDSELILFTPAFGSSTEPGEGAEVVLDASGRVTALREGRGGRIPPREEGGFVLSGTGEGFQWLMVHARPGAMVDVSFRISAEGATLAAGTGVVNGGPRLLTDGEPDVTAAAEGFVYATAPEFYYRFGVRRNPRILAGVTPEGNLLLVGADGRRPGYSVGASFEESAGVMDSLGAGGAVNLDGGGSNAVTVGEKLVNRPSDATGERPIGDAVVVAPLEPTRTGRRARSACLPQVPNYSGRRLLRGGAVPSRARRSSREGSLVRRLRGSVREVQSFERNFNRPLRARSPKTESAFLYSERFEIGGRDSAVSPVREAWSRTEFVPGGVGGRGCKGRGLARRGGRVAPAA